MLKQLVAHASHDFWRICNSVLNRFRPVTDVRATKVAVRNLIRGPIKLTENRPLCYSRESLLNYAHFDTILRLCFVQLK